MKVDIQYLSTRQAAQRLGVSLGTVQNMVEKGVLSAWKTSGGHRRIPLAAVEAMIARRPSPLANDQPIGKEVSLLDILMTENDQTQQRLYKTSIAQWNLPVEVRMAENGFDGLIEVGRKTPDILIVKLLTPGMDSQEMIRHLRANPQLDAMDVIAISSTESAAPLVEELPARVTLLGNPLPLDELKGFILGRLASRQRAA